MILPPSAEYIWPIGQRRMLMALRRPLLAYRIMSRHMFLRPSEERHVFVVGPSRSGTTLVYRILLAHSLLVGPEGETFYFLKWDYTNAKFGELPQRELKAIFESAKNKIVAYDNIASAYKKQFSGKVFIEKTPHHAMMLSKLLKWFPNSKFVFLVRDCRDAFLSALRNPLVGDRTMESYAQTWRSCILELEKNQHRDNVHKIYYEQLCLDPKTIVKELTGFLEIDFCNMQIDHRVFGNTTISDAPGHKRLRSAISARTVGEWRTMLDKNDLYTFEDIGGSLSRALGYDKSF